MQGEVTHGRHNLLSCGIYAAIVSILFGTAVATSLRPYCSCYVHVTGTRIIYKCMLSSSIFFYNAFWYFYLVTTLVYMPQTQVQRFQHQRERLRSDIKLLNIPSVSVDVEMVKKFEDAKILDH